VAYPAYLSVKGAKQGQFKGESTLASRKNWIPILAFEMALESPHDAATGQASGIRRYKQIVIAKEWGAASPQAMTACATNETLTSVTLDFAKADSDGKPTTYQTIILTNAIIVQVYRTKGKLARPGHPLSAELHAEHSGSVDVHELEEWEFVFQQIEFSDVDGLTTFTDDWEAQ